MRLKRKLFSADNKKHVQLFNANIFQKQTVIPLDSQLSKLQFLHPYYLTLGFEEENNYNI